MSARAVASTSSWRGGSSPDLDAVKREVIERDHRDSNRPIAPLKMAADAEVVDSSGVPIEDVVERIVTRVKSLEKELARAPVTLVRGPVLVLGAALALGCASRSLPPPPPQSPLVDAKSALPPDLDLVVRVDLARVRSALGPSAVADLRRAAQSSSGLEGSDSLLGPLFEHADVLLVGVRPRLATDLDHVIVLEGRFDDFDPSKIRTEPPGSARSTWG